MTAPPRLPAIDTQLLVVLDALLAEQSVARGARRLALSPSATSHALARLRELFGDPLLVRARRRLVPTARARELAPRVHALVSAMPELFTPAATPAPAELRDRLVSLVRAGHPLLRGRLTPERLVDAEHVLVAPRGVARGVLDDQLARLGLRRRVARTLATFLPAPFLVAGSDRVVTLSFRLAELLGPLLGLRRLEPPEALGLRPYLIEALGHRRSDDDARHRFLRETLGRVAAGLPPIAPPRRIKPPRPGTRSRRAPRRRPR